VAAGVKALVAIGVAITVLLGLIWIELGGLSTASSAAKNLARDVRNINRPEERPVSSGRPGGLPWVDPAYVPPLQLPPSSAVSR
jgi:hypothetical protein